MKQIQHQTQSQRLALSQAMLNSLSLLSMDQEEIAEEIVAEKKRNPFLRAIPYGGSSGTAPLVDEVAQNEQSAHLLLQQIGYVQLSDPERALARELAYCLDARGFLADSAAEMCGYLNTTPDMLHATIAKLQTALEPTGVFAWSLADCFRIQLEAQNKYDPLIAKLLNKLQLVARQDVDAICKHCEVDAEDARDMMADIRALNPAPFATTPSSPETSRSPDLIFEPADDGGFNVMLNPDALPKLLTDDALFSKYMQVETDKSALAYYRDCYRAAGSFVIAMQKRANTLLKIGSYVAQTQRRYLTTGRLIDRAPLTMSDMAAKIDLNKSTISRAMNGCQAVTPHGVVAAFDFFVRPLSAHSDGKTREQALRRMALLIKTEDKSKPLSDQKLADLMNKANFAITRRTIAKYRTLTGHPPASARRT